MLHKSDISRTQNLQQFIIGSRCFPWMSVNQTTTGEFEKRGFLNPGYLTHISTMYETVKTSLKQIE